MLEVNIKRMRYLIANEKGKKVKGPVVLQNLVFSVSFGEIICILGPSGCGKTTLLNIITGLIDNFDGEIFFPEKRPRISYVFQTPRLLPWRTVYENIEIAANVVNSPPAFVKRLLEEVGLLKFSHYFPSQLSLGMQRRIALARAFVRRPSLLLMDEPFTSLDEKLRVKLYALLLRMWKTHKTTILFVTHDNREAEQLATRTLTLPASLAKTVERL